MLTVQANIAADYQRLDLTAAGEERAVRQLLAAAGVPFERSVGAAIGVRPRYSGPAIAAIRSRARVRQDDSIERYVANRRQAFERHGPLLAQVRELQHEGVELGRRLLADVDSSGLDDHQVVNVAAGALADAYGCCFFDEQGAGKTVSGIFTWNTLVQRRIVDRMLVVAPKAMIGEWARDLERFTGGLYEVTQVVGSVRDKRSLLRQAADVYVTNFETAISLQAELIGAVRGGGRRTLLIVDESFLVKNPDSGRSQALFAVREWCERCLVLCGTPAPNSASDLISQFNLADFGVCFEDVSLSGEVEADHTVVQGAIEQRGVYLRNLKRDVLPNLPRRRFTVVPVELAARQRAAYDAAAQSLASDLDATDEHGFRTNLASFGARRSALLQLCSNPSGVLDGYDERPAKQAALLRLVSGLVDAGEKLIVWSFYTASIDATCRLLAPFGVRRFDGTISDTVERREAVRAFQEDDAVRVMVANPAAAGAGLTLTAARYAIYESFSNQAAHFLQSLDRIHRRGQEREVEYIVLLADDTIEQAEYARLLRKEAAAQDLLGDGVDGRLTRQAMLEELAPSVPTQQSAG